MAVIGWFESRTIYGLLPGAALRQGKESARNSNASSDRRRWQKVLGELFDWESRAGRAALALTQAPCTPALAHAPSLGTDRTRNAHAPTYIRSTGFFAIWVCISSSYS